MTALPDSALSPLFMLRVAGLPVTTVHRLRSTASSRWADQVVDQENQLAARGTALSDLLHQLIKSNEDDRSRRGLLTLRRQVFRNVLPPDPGGALDLVRDLDGEVAAQLADWLRDRQALTGLLNSGAALLAGELADNRRQLRQLVDEQPLRLGLLLASPVLAGQLAQLPPGPTGRDKRGRRLERSLLSYLYRTACKTSPFSTFTSVALGSFVPGTADATVSRPDVPPAGPADRIDLPGSWSSRVRLNVVVLGRLAELIVADPARRADLPVELTAGWRHDDERIRYVRHWVTAGDDSAPVSFDSIRDRLFFLRRSGLLDRLIDLFAQRPVLRCGELVRWLAAEQHAPPQECERYLSALLDLGMLQVRCLRVNVHTPDPLRTLRDALDGLGRPWATELARRLAGPIGYLDRYPTADIDLRRHLLAQLRADLVDIARDLGAVDTSLPQALVYEDVRVDDEPARLSLDRWEHAVLPGLRTVERILPAFDPTLADRILFKGFFTARFGVGGRCDDVLKLVEDFHEDLYRQYASYTSERGRFDEHGGYLPEENWLGLPAITALDNARQHFTAYMRTRLAGHPPDAELHLDDGIVAELTARLAPLNGRYVAQGHFVQLIAGHPDPLVVLNQSYGGLSFGFSRFTHCFTPGAGDPHGRSGPDLAEQLREQARLIQPEGTVLAEVTGGAASTNLNLHGRLVDYEIVNPGETSSVPSRWQIPLDDLGVVHDPDEDRLVLVSRRLDREVIPLYFGYLIPAALPEIARTLLLLSPTLTGRLDVWAGVPASEDVSGVTARPRVRYGNVVLSRRSWHVESTDLPLHAPGVDEHVWFLGWRRWRLAHGLPGQVFATVYPTGPAAGRPAKPQYLDFDSVLSLSALEGLVVTGPARLVLREMLPTEDQLHVWTDRGPHVAELAVQTQRRTR